MLQHAPTCAARLWKGGKAASTVEEKATTAAAASRYGLIELKLTYAAQGCSNGMRPDTPAPPLHRLMTGCAEGP